MFVLATSRSINMGALAFAAAFGVGTLAGGMEVDEILARFPGDLFVVLVGVTYLFGIARANGTTDWLVHRSIQMVGRRLALIPWTIFGISALLTAIGAVSPAAVAIVAPIALGFVGRYGFSPLLMGAMVVHGAQAGGFSPISIYGSIVNGIVAREGLPGSEGVLFLASFLVNLAVAAVVFVVCGGFALTRSSADRQSPGLSEGDPPAGTSAAGELRLTPARRATLASVLALAVGALALDLHVGLSAISLAVVLSAVWPEASRKAVSGITWPTVLLICGVLTYVGVLQALGTVDYAGTAVGRVGVPLVGALLLCYIGGIVSAFASSVGIMGALIPLAVPFLAQGTVGPIGMIAALAVSATVVDVSPFSTNGALVLANARDVERERFFRQLLIYGGIIVAVVPAAVWLVLVVPGVG